MEISSNCLAFKFFVWSLNGKNDKFYYFKCRLDLVVYLDLCIEPVPAGTAATAYQHQDHGSEKLRQEAVHQKLGMDLSRYFNFNLI